MAIWFKPYFVIYGALHLGAGLAFWAFPSLTRIFLFEPLPAESAALMGFASALAGLGFMGAALVTVVSQQRVVILLSIAGNILNLAIHVQNVVNGHSPTYLLWLAGGSMLGMSAVLVSMWLSMKSELGH